MPVHHMMMIMNNHIIKEHSIQKYQENSWQTSRKVDVLKVVACKFSVLTLLVGHDPI